MMAIYCNTLYKLLTWHEPLFAVGSYAQICVSWTSRNFLAYVFLQKVWLATSMSATYNRVVFFPSFCKYISTNIYVWLAKIIWDTIEDLAFENLNDWIVKKLTDNLPYPDVIAVEPTLIVWFVVILMGDTRDENLSGDWSWK